MNIPPTFTEKAQTLPTKILLVDDESSFLDVLARRIEQRGYLVKTAQDCASALSDIELGWPDAVVLDVMLGDADGIECLCHIKRVAPMLPVLMLTGHASLQTGLLSLEQGASNYCLKPIGVDDLIEKIIIACKEVGEEP